MAHAFLEFIKQIANDVLLSFMILVFSTLLLVSSTLTKFSSKRCSDFFSDDQNQIKST